MQQAEGKNSPLCVHFIHRVQITNTNNYWNPTTHH